MSLIDAWHYGTEKFTTNLLTERFSAVPVFSAEKECDQCGYV